MKNKYRVSKTEGNNNTLLGIAKTIFLLKRNEEIFIAEMAAYKRGEIKEICLLVRPKIGIITVIGPMHLERFGTLKAIRETKLELLGVIEENGKVMMPKTLFSFVKKDKDKVYFFNHLDEVVPQVGKILNLSSLEINSCLKKKLRVPHRQQIIKSGPLTIIDDTYNSNPEGFEIALGELKKIKASKRILITPGMIEMEDLQAEENFKAAQLAARICNEIIIVGTTNREALLA